MQKNRILVVDDDQKIGVMLKRALDYEGYEVTVVHSGEDALLLLLEKPFDLVILDIMLPGLDGWAVCQEIRVNSSIPIIMLTAKDEVEQRVKGLDSGADDYVVKPFALDELLARIRAQLRRHQPPREKADHLHFANIELNLSSRECKRGDQKIDLRGKEFELLEHFMLHPHIVLAKEQLLQHVWGFDYEGESNVIEVYIASLRSKLEKHGHPRLIHTVRGSGYILRED
ncbi:response regulator transcription factor [Ammoniphilus sp. CFH 90114]|uniref:response regulator transcription factor n=1 Tax=Ammoniphilus sp. CFH 90114 TaxID=2493665 RepID=UPI00100F1711|nr:response regulator transcription factor [Ammoniphilus sp. CFH 90114]RXT13922.1 response regulator transcription factor [Ammoniphilus sp. CFH 90114]